VGIEPEDQCSVTVISKPRIRIVTESPGHNANLHPSTSQAKNTRLKASTSVTKEPWTYMERFVWQLWPFGTAVRGFGNKEDLACREMVD